MTSPDIPPQAITAEALARMFHEAYERLAPSHGYETRKASAVPWDAVPEPNRSLMIAVAAEVLEAAAPHLAAVPAGIIRIEGKLSQAELEELAGQWKAAWHKGEYTILPDDTEARIGEAVAAERERCAQLALAHGALAIKCSRGVAPKPGSECACRTKNAKFPIADLLREQP